VNQAVVEDRPDGTLIVSTRVGHANEVLPVVRYWLPHLRIVGPIGLRLRLESELRAYLAAGEQLSGTNDYKEEEGQ
jgi:hypothetical protein